MNLLPLIAAALAAGVAIHAPLLAAALVVPAVVAKRLRPARVHALAFLLGTLLPTAPHPSALAVALPRGAPLLRVEGVVRTGPNRAIRGRVSFDLDVERAGGRPLEGRIRVLAPEGAPLPSPGDRVAATGRLRRPRPAENPGERGPRRALADRGVTHLLSLATAPSLRIVEPAAVLSPPRLVHRARLALDEALRERVAPPARDLLRSLLIGRRDLLPESVEDDFRRSGTSHFLAISGLHVGLLAGLLLLFLRPLPLPRPVRAAAVALTALFYAAVTGLRPSAVRAALFVTLWSGGVLLRRPVRVLNLVALAAVSILLADPAALSRAGFQLSFTAVLAIVHLSAPISEGLFGRWKLVDRFSVPRSRPWPVRVLRRYLMSAVPVSLAAWLGTAPLALARFGTVSSLVLPANLLVFPLVAALIPAGILAGFTGFSLPAELLSRTLLGLVRGLASLPGAAVTVPPPPLLLLALYAAGLLWLGRRPALGTRSLGLALAGLAILTASGPLLRGPPDRPRLTVLSVGHGLCVVLETPENGVFVYDAGSTRPAVFRRVILPWLRHRGISAVDVLVVSHDDFDHAGAVATLARTLPVRRLYRPERLSAGTDITLPGARLEVLHPPAGTPVGDNDGSIVVRVRAGGLTVLLTGDIEEVGIRRLLDTCPDPRADVLVLPHHGRPTALAGELQRAVGARVLLSSDGPSEPFDPAWEGAIQTSESGAIVVEEGGRVRTFRGGPLPP